MEHKKSGKRTSTKTGKAPEIKGLDTEVPEKISNKKSKNKPDTKVATKKSKNKDMSDTVSSKKKDGKDQIAKKSEKNTKRKIRVKREKVPDSSKMDATTSTVTLDQDKVESGKQKSKSKNIVSKKSKKDPKRKKKKYSKKSKNTIDNVGKNDIIGPKEKSGKAISEEEKQTRLYEDDDDFKENQKPKRKKGVRAKKASDFEVAYQFNNSIDDQTGDARADFNKRSDGTMEYIWCLRRNCRIHVNICGLYVKPSCNNKKRCQYYDHGMTVKSKYRLKTLEDPQKEVKKRKIVDGEELVDIEGDNDID